VTALLHNLDEEATAKVRTKWSEWGEGVELIVIASPYRSLVGPLVRYVDRRLSLNSAKIITVVLRSSCPGSGGITCLQNDRDDLGGVKRQSPIHVTHQRADQRAIRRCDDDQLDAFAPFAPFRAQLLRGFLIEIM